MTNFFSLGVETPWGLYFCFYQKSPHTCLTWIWSLVFIQDNGIVTIISITLIRFSSEAQNVEKFVLVQDVEKCLPMPLCKTLDNDDYDYHIIFTII